LEPLHFPDQEMEAQYITQLVHQMVQIWAHFHIGMVDFLVFLFIIAL
jgi:hypothetical protein